MLEEVKLIDQITVLEIGVVLVREATRVMKDGIMISETYHRSSINPEQSFDGFPEVVQRVCAAARTKDAVTAYVGKGLETLTHQKAELEQSKAEFEEQKKKFAEELEASKALISKQAQENQSLMEAAKKAIEKESQQLGELRGAISHEKAILEVKSSSLSLERAELDKRIASMFEVIQASGNKKEEGGT